MTKKSSASSQRGLRHRVKSDDITLTGSMLRELQLLKHRKPDLSDEEAPEITNWEKTVVGKFYRPMKKQITVRIDADVLAWFKQAATKYQTLINAACREYMLHHDKNRKKNKQSSL